MENKKAGCVEVEYRNGLHEIYEKTVLGILMDDPNVLHILDLDTDELLK